MITRVMPVFFDMQGIRKMRNVIKVGDKLTIMKSVRRDTEHGIRTFEVASVAKVIAKYPHIVRTNLGDADYKTIALLNQNFYNEAQRRDCGRMERY